MKRALLPIIAISMALYAGFAYADDLKDYQPKPYVEITHPTWSRNAVIYELNTRNFTKEGTFKAAQKQLPRLKAMGVDIVWLMPIHPIGEKNRKGTLGSPYSVRDYFAVNPEFGTKDDLKAFVDEAHKLGMHVILDLVANHTAWDNVMVAKHPDWWERDIKGHYHPTPWWDWSDIIDLDYSKPELRKYMTDAMVYWVKNYGIDGYRADVAGYVPVDFWDTARAKLDKIKPVFMLGEWQDISLHRKAFDATYAWDWYNSMENIAHGKGDATSLYGYYSANESAWPKDTMRMVFTENHDKNAWEGTGYEAFGDALPAAIALSFIGEGIPLIHNGQEACNKKRLAFFEKDEIKWGDCDITTLFSKLVAIKRSNPALQSAQFGGRMIKIENDNPQHVFSFLRKLNANKVVGVFNFSAKPAKVTLHDDFYLGNYYDLDGEPASIVHNQQLELNPWEFKIYRTDK